MSFLCSKYTSERANPRPAGACFGVATPRSHLPTARVAYPAARRCSGKPVMLYGTPAVGTSGSRSDCVTCTGSRPERNAAREGVQNL